MTNTVNNTPRLSTPDVGLPFAMDFNIAGPATPIRQLRSYSHRHRSDRLEGLDGGFTAGIRSTPVHPRLRRVRASLSPKEDNTASPIVSIEVNKDSFIEDAISKTKALIYEKESAEDYARHLPSPGSVKSFATIFTDFSWGGSIFSGSSPTRSRLQRKSKSEDLRLLYAATESDKSQSSSITTASIKESEQQTTWSWSVLSDDRKKTSTDAVVWRDGLSCFCDRSSHPAHGSMLACTVCEDWYHLHCIGMGQSSASAQEAASFVCPKSDEFAPRDAAAKED